MLLIIGGTDFLYQLFEILKIPFLSTQLEHSIWNGCTFFDFIFPLFLFIVGTSISFSLGKRVERGDDRRSIYFHICKRTLTLFLLGLVVNGILTFNFNNLRYAGVLQRISLGYFFASIIMLNVKIKYQAIITGAILLLYWAAMMLIPVPGFGAGVLTPEGNLAAYIDQKFLPGVFYGKYGDNEGILSTFPAISTALIGLLSGHLLRSSLSVNKKTKRLALSGLFCIFIGLVWNLFFPINKLIWSSSFVLYTGGWSILFLCLFYWIIDVAGYKKWAFPLTVIGMNALTIYVTQAIFDFGIITNIFLQGFINYVGIWKPLLSSIAILIVKWLFLYFLWKQRIFLKA